MIPGCILCRLPNETAEVCEIGKLLREGDAGDTEFIIREEGGDAQHFPITTEIVEKMINNLHFRMAEIQIRVVKNLPFQAGLRWNGEDFSISGFPRTLLRDRSQTMSKMSFERVDRIFLTNNCYEGQHQAAQWADLETRRHSRWTMPPLDESVMNFNAAAFPHELEALESPQTVTIQQERQNTAELEESSPRRSPTEGKCLYGLVYDADYLTKDYTESTLLGVAGPSLHWKKPSLSSTAASSATYNEPTAIGDTSENSRYLTIKFSTDKGTSSQTYQLSKLKSVADLPFSLLDLEDFVQSMKETHLDYTAPLLSSSPAFEMRDSLLGDQPSPSSRSSISSTIPPRIPDFPWRNEQTLTFELVDI